jgi:hypothetical protein
MDGRTVLILKGKDQVRPITCLPVMWKLLTGVLVEKIYEHLEYGLLTEEQKGCRRKWTNVPNGTKDQLLIDKLISYATAEDGRQDLGWYMGGL